MWLSKTLMLCESSRNYSSSERKSHKITTAKIFAMWDEAKSNAGNRRCLKSAAKKITSVKKTKVVTGAR